jgi:hypothetical protein
MIICISLQIKYLIIQSFVKEYQYSKKTVKTILKAKYLTFYFFCGVTFKVAQSYTNSIKRKLIFANPQYYNSAILKVFPLPYRAIKS